MQIGFNQYTSFVHVNTSDIETNIHKSAVGSGLKMNAHFSKKKKKKEL